jgi:uncharacterized protein with HEPN domain
VKRKDLRVRDYLGHVLQAIERIERYTADLDQSGFVASDLTQDAVIRNLEVIGEAFRNIERVDPGFAARHPDLPLRAASGMRNLLSHGYFAVDLNVVWRTIETSLPLLKQQVRRLTAELDPD